MDRMLHRGQYATGQDAAKPGGTWTWSKIIGSDEEFTVGDKWIAGSLFVWTLI